MLQLITSCLLSIEKEIITLNQLEIVLKNKTCK